MKGQSAGDSSMSGGTLGRFIDDAASRFGNKDAFCIGDRRITYAELRRSSDELAKGFLGAGVARGDRVALWMGNHLEWLICFYAIAKIGAIIVPVSTRLMAEEAAYVLEQCGVNALVLNDHFLNVDFVDMLYELVPGIRATPQERPLSARFPSLRTVISFSPTRKKYPGLTDFQEVMNAGQETTGQSLIDAAAKVGGKDTFLIQYTSGTTGFPKGAMLTHENFVRTGHQVGLRQELKESDRFFSPAPYFHVSGTMHALTAPLAFGCTVYSLERYELENAVEAICRNQCNVYHGFNFFKDFFSRRNELGKDCDLGVIERAWTTGTVVELTNIMGLGIDICNLYGLSETTGCSTICSPSDSAQVRIQTVGKPLAGVEVCIKDRAGKALPPAQKGEICIRGWNVMTGYYNKPAETRESFDEEGWFHSGDLGALDPDNNLVFRGRIKDIIRVGGENVSPFEVENFLRRNPKVAEACVVGIPDARLGEAGMAFIRLQRGKEASEEEIIEYCRNKIAKYKIPRYVRFVEEFPLTGNNKIKRYEVREIAARELAWVRADEAED